MRKHFIDSHTLFLAVLLVLPAVFSQAHAAQVITDEVRQWARQAVREEASLEFKPGADTVAVLYFQNRTERPDLDFLQKGMTVMLMTDLAKVEGVNVVERYRLQALMQEMKLGAAGIVADHTALRMGNLLGAGYIAGGNLTAGRAGGFHIDASLLDAPRETVLGSPSSSGILNDLLRMEKQIVFELVRLLRIELSDEQEARLRKPITTNIKALMLLVSGIDSSDQGDYARAAEYYRQALERDPDLETAEAAITELEDLKLIPSATGPEALLRKLGRRVSVNMGPIPNLITRRHNSEPASVQGPAGAGQSGGPQQPADVGDVDVDIQW